MEKITLLTWNIGKRKAASWDILMKLGADIYLLQECSKKLVEEKTEGINAITSLLPGKPFGVSILSKLSIEQISFEEFSGRVVIGIISNGAKSICVINVHVPSDKDPTVELNKILDKIEPIIKENKDRLVLAGDLNVGIFFDIKYKHNKNREVLERIQNYGLKMYPLQETMTHLHKGEWYPDDYVFVSNGIKCDYQVLDIEKYPWADHKPILANISW